MMELPKCMYCETGTLVPLSDYDKSGSSVFFKAWVCTHKPCGFMIKISSGKPLYGRCTEEVREPREAP